MYSPSPLPSQTSTDSEVEYIHEFSPRNFFSVINFLHILQKLTKRKLHRVLLLVQYKSSVGAQYLKFAWLTSALSGDSEASAQGASPASSTLYPQSPKKPDTLLREEMATMYVTCSIGFAVLANCTTIPANMKVITSIYINCRPDLRDEWLIGADIDGDVEDSLVSVMIMFNAI